MGLWNCGVCRIGQSIDPACLKCPQCGHSQEESVVAIDKISAPYWAKFDLKGLLKQIDSEIAKAFLHNDQREELQKARCEIETCIKELREAEDALRNKEFDRSRAVYNGIAGRLRNKAGQAKIKEKLKAVDKAEASYKKKKAREARRLLYIGLAIISGFLAFVFVIPALERSSFERRMDRLVQSGRIAEAIMECQTQWEKNRKEYAREIGSELWSKEREMKEQAEELHSKALLLLEQNRFAEATTLISQCLRLINDEVFLKTKQLIEQEERRHLIDQEQKRLGDLMESIPANIRSKMSQIGSTRQGYLRATLGGFIDMIFIPAGEFKMGSNKGKRDARPEHQVSLDGYWIGLNEITTSQFSSFVREAKVRWQVAGTKDQPAVSLSWDLADSFCEWLSRETGLRFSLPSEAQWERAAEMQAGAARENGFDSTNMYGIKGMYDDIQEWCYDFYDEGYYSRSPRKNPKGPEKGNYHEAVVRGTSKRGGDGRPAFTMRFKASLSPDFKSDKIGFRVVMQ